MTTMRWVSRISVGSGNGSGSPTPSMIDTVSVYNNIKYKCVRKGCIDEELKEKKASSLSMSRREAIGSVCGFGIVNGFMYTQPPEGCASASDSNECEFKVAPSGLEFCDKVVGEGDEAVKGQLIKAHYVGKLESGKVFDSSYNRGKPLTFRIGVGEVIKGWDQGILGGDGVPPMLPGGKRVLKLPPQLGYGARGAGCRGGSCIIPPDSILVFDVEFIGNP